MTKHNNVVVKKPYSSLYVWISGGLSGGHYHCFTKDINNLGKWSSVY